MILILHFLLLMDEIVILIPNVDEIVIQIPHFGPLLDEIVILVPHFGRNSDTNPAFLSIFERFWTS